MLRSRLRRLEGMASAGRPQIDSLAALMRYVTLQDAGQWAGPEPFYTPEMQRAVHWMAEREREDQAREAGQ